MEKNGTQWSKKRLKRNPIPGNIPMVMNIHRKLPVSFQGVRQWAAGTDLKNGRVRKGHRKLLRKYALALERNIQTPSFRLFFPDGIYCSVSLRTEQYMPFTRDSHPL